MATRYADILLRPAPPRPAWQPSPDQQAGKQFDALIPLLVDKIRREVYEWREGGYKKCSDTSLTLINFWFGTEHPTETGEFRFYPQPAGSHREHHLVVLCS